MLNSLDRSELNRRMEMTQQIIDVLRGKTGNNFQNAMYIVLKAYYDYTQKTFEMPQAMRGDYKNDGWVVEDKVFYMMFSPILLSKSFYNEIQDKLRSDLLGKNGNPGLLTNVYEKGMWGGKIAQAILLVNTKDNRLPPNNTDEYNKIIEEGKNKYHVDFKCSVENLEFIESMLNDLDSSILYNVMFKLNMARGVDYNEPSATDIITTIGMISKTAMESYIRGFTTNYKRISTKNKIKINNLQEIKSEIEMIISKLYVVDRAVNEMSQDIYSLERFNYAKNYVIKVYLDNKDKYSGVELFNSIICDISKLFSDLDNHVNEIKYLVIYIFDKCDIFEKEEIQNDITK